MNYFELLGLTPTFLLDASALETAYFQQQRRYHPDRFVGKPPAERQQAMQRSVDINQAYNTLKNPLNRAQYLLRLQGITLGTEQDSVKPSPALLMETMELREQVFEAADMAQLAKMDEAIEKMIARSVHLVSETYNNRQWDAMAQETLRLGYLIKAREETAQQKTRLSKQAS